MIDFTGTGYLGLQYEPEFIKLISEGMSKYGVNTPTSRLFNYDFNEVEKMENNIARLLNTEDAVLFNSGFLAGITIRDYLKKCSFQKAIPIVEMPRLHPCLINNDIYPYKIIEEHFLTEKIADLLKKEHFTNCILFSNLIDSFVGAIEPVVFYYKSLKPFWFVIDISHAFYVVNIENIITPEMKDRVIFISSTGKASSIPGGFIAGKKQLMTDIRQLMPGYSTSSPLSQSLAYAFNRSEDIKIKKKERLNKNIEYFERTIKFTPVNSGKEVKIPIYCLGKNQEKIFKLLYENNIFCSYLSYPGFDSPKYLRIVIKSLHTYENIDKLALLLNKTRFKISTKSYTGRGRVIYPTKN